MLPRLKLTEDVDSKKVSRAESWRYEGSMYIKPPGLQTQRTPGATFIAPPSPPDFVTRQDAQDGDTADRRPQSGSISSTPLIRPKNPRILEASFFRNKKFS